jgi:hypothetical protein
MPFQDSDAVEMDISLGVNFHSTTRNHWASLHSGSVAFRTIVSIIFAKIRWVESGCPIRTTEGGDLCTDGFVGSQEF